ncbi:MAG: tRNA 2-thiouridine(34) synthase MnmA [Candidatus Peribacteraceae bacterium]|nr:tRNA 2-thiouridine(34) synthase MnmA [Candidatus Peribacteraceae bacterium]
MKPDTLFPLLLSHLSSLSSSLKILLAMSGGIDSGVCAHLLKRQGHEVIGVRLHLWMDPLAPPMAQLMPSKCCTTQSINRASNIAKSLGIPLHTVDVASEFKKKIVDQFLKDYAAGLTPNPCVLCNRTIKHATLIKLMKKYRCDKVATGHYARIKCKTDRSGKSICQLLEARDTTKDQSYYLYSLSQEQLASTIFPLGDLLKSEVYKLAKKFKIPLSDAYRESQDLCFFPEQGPSAFLKRHLKKAKAGEIVKRDSSVVGKHSGIPFYTIGQRHGLGIGGLKIPLQVVAKDTKRNRLIVAERGQETCKKIMLTDLHFIAGTPPKDGKYTCRTRSLSAKKKGTFTINICHGERSRTMTCNDATFTFAHPEPLQSPGQSLVLYKGNEIIGGGTIDEICSILEQ